MNERAALLKTATIAAVLAIGMPNTEPCHRPSLSWAMSKDEREQLNRISDEKRKQKKRERQSRKKNRN